MDSSAATAGPSQGASTSGRPPTRTTKRDRLHQKPRVSFAAPDDMPSVELAVVEPACEEAEDAAVLSARWANNRGVNCSYVDQASQLCIMGIPLADMWFSIFSVFLLMGSNALLVHVCVALMKRKDDRYFYMLAWLIVERLMAATYRCWSSTRKGCMYAVTNMLVALVYLDTFATAISLLCMANGSYMVNLFAIEGTAKSTKRWTALPFLSAPGKLVTRMKMMCLLSSGPQSWQMLGMIAALTDKKRPMSESEGFHMLTSVLCSAIFVCWAATCSLPTVPVPQLFINGYYVVFRTTVKMIWLVSIALSRITTFYVFSVAYHYHLLTLGGAQSLAVLAYCLVVKRYSVATPTPSNQPSVVKLLVVSSMYMFVFVHPQKGILDHGYGLFHFFYLTENIIILYNVLEIVKMGMGWVFISLGFYTVGVCSLFGLTVLYLMVPHQNVHVDRTVAIATS